MVEDVHELQVSNDMVLWFPVISYTTVIIFVFVILSTGFFCDRIIIVCSIWL